MAPTENTPLRGVAADATASQRKKRVAAIVGVVAVAAVALGYYVTSGSHSSSSSAAATTVVAPLTEPSPAPTTVAPVAETPAPTTAANRTVGDVTCGIANTEAGYIELPNKRADNYFYWYYESRASPSTDPLVVWLTGGPGCSSLMALLTENGPCSVQPDLSTELNPYSWNAHANVVWLDQPSNVGYSFTTEASDVDKDEDDVGDNFWWFMNGFLDKHPELEGRDLYITGESYAGHYVPAAAHKIWLQNKVIKEVGTPVRLNLKGIAIGNGLTNPLIQFAHQLDMVNNTYNITLMTDDEYKRVKELQPKCGKLFEQLLKEGNFSKEILQDPRIVECQVVLQPFKNSHRNPYDIRLPCGDVADATQCYDITYVSEYLNSDAVRKYLNVTSEPKKQWLECDPNVGFEFMKSGDEVVNYENYVADLLNDGGVRVLLYVGDADTVCNWYGNKAWSSALEWEHKTEFNTAEEHPFLTSNGTVDAGITWSYKNQFTFIRLFNSGHMVPRDQPAVALEMIEKFFNGETF